MGLSETLVPMSIREPDWRGGIYSWIARDQDDQIFKFDLECDKLLFQCFGSILLLHGFARLNEHFRTAILVT